MPKPLTAKSPTQLSTGEQAVALIALGVPAAVLWYCFTRHCNIHLENPWLNLAAHAGLALFPFMGLWLFFRTPVVYESSDNDIDLGHSGYFSTLSVGWWGMFMMWATPVFFAVATAMTFQKKYLNHPEDLSTSPGRAILIMAVIFWLGVFYATILLGRSEPSTRVSEEGIRTGIMRFHKWEDIHHISRRENLYTIYHRANPALPAAAFRIRSPELENIVQRVLSAHVQISNDSDPAYLSVRIAVVAGFALNLAASFWMRWNTALSLIWITLISFAIGIAMTLVLEKYRGVSKFGKCRPIFELGEAAAPDQSQSLNG